MQHANPPSGTFAYQSEPRALRTRPKYRAQETAGGATMYGNLMHDPRVVRGNTYRQQLIPTASQVDPVAVQKAQEKRRLAQAKARQLAKMRVPDVEPVHGRAHIEVQTELYLEELTDKVEEADQSVQTDPFLDRPPEPLFIPAKTGLDVATQIEDGDLFDFDLESKPILEVLVGKTIEQSLLEVMEEEELDALRDHQAEFEELRNAELIETQRLEEQARRRREERERRLRQQAEVAVQERETTKKIAARSFAQSYLSGLVPSVFDNLDNNGYFYDSQEREIEEQFLPWLMDGVDANLSRQTTARTLLDALVRDVVLARAAKYGGGEPAEGGGGDDAAAAEGGEGAAVDAAEADAAEADAAEGDAAEGGTAGGDAAAEATPAEGGEGAAVGGDTSAAGEGDAAPAAEGDVAEGGDAVEGGDSAELAPGDEAAAEAAPEGEAAAEAAPDGQAGAEDAAPAEGEAAAAPAEQAVAPAEEAAAPAEEATPAAEETAAPDAE